MSLLALLGLRDPVRLLPVLLFETGWKVLWLSLVALPRAVAGDVDPATADLVVHVPRAPRRGRLVELVPRTASGVAAVEPARSALAGEDRTCVVCRHRAGFVVEALLFPHLNDAARMVDDGYASADDVDTAMRLGCGYPEGPFAMLDTIGPAVVASALPGIAAAFPSPAVVPAPLLMDLAGP
jgi:3-hydroxybutyryl-CoA dehydrogenase